MFPASVCREKGAEEEGQHSRGFYRMSGRFELLTGVETFYSKSSALYPRLNVEWSSMKSCFPQPPGLIREEGQRKAIRGDEQRVTEGAAAAFSQTIKKVNSQDVDFSVLPSPLKFRMMFSL